MPSLYGVASDSAISGQKVLLWITRTRLLALILVTIASVLSTVVTERPLLLVVAVAFVVAVGLEVALWAFKPERRWYDGRAAAESLKTLVWRYCVKGQPFDETLEDRTADELFLDRIEEVLHGLRSIPPGTAHYEPGAQITPEMRSLRQSDAKDRIEAYDKERIQNQQVWYARNSADNIRRARVWTALLILLECCGLALVGLEVGNVLEVEVISIVAVLGTSVVAWMGTRQFRSLAEAYFVASHELTMIRTQIYEQNESSWAAFVDNAEEAISREHTLWKASRGHDRV